MKPTTTSFLPSEIRLAPGLFLDRFNLVRRYLLSLKSAQLLRSFHLESGLVDWSVVGGTDTQQDPEAHRGWEAPSCQLRGHFLGHWLSSAAQVVALTGDAELKGKADHIVAELANCQEANGDGWLGPSPEKYLDWVRQGRVVWAPQYVHHKTFMGLLDMHVFTGNAQALELAVAFAGWFHRWTAPFSREKMDDVLDSETGGMLEAFADLQHLRPSQMNLDLIERYTRGRLFDPLLEGRDVLTNMHANTTIPEVLGAARCHEVLGGERWRRIVEAYWDLAVERRGAFCTGGQTAGEVWNPPGQLAARRGPRNQEHCTVYNMIRLADCLFRWTGEARYLDYIERNIYNGILAQQNPTTGMVAYFLPMEAGGQKKWGHPTRDFWCCHGSMVQAHPMLQRMVCYRTETGVFIGQFIPSTLRTLIEGTPVSLQIEIDRQAGHVHTLKPGTSAMEQPALRPSTWRMVLRVSCEAAKRFTLQVRVPEWTQGTPRLEVNGDAAPVEAKVGVLALKREWREDTVIIEFDKVLRSEPLPDEPRTVAFLDGPVVVAGLIPEEVRLECHAADPTSVLAPSNEREWGRWNSDWRTVDQPKNFRLTPLHRVVDEPYTLYFPIQTGTKVGP